MSEAALIQDGYTDYRLRASAQSVWVGVDNLYVYIVRTDEGVSVDIYPHQLGPAGPIAGTWALFDEGNDPEEEETNDANTDDER